MMTDCPRSNLASLRFSWDLPTWAILAIAILTGLAAAWLYLKETRQLAGTAAWVLPALRSTAIILTILLLAGPIWHHRQVIGQPARLIFAVDQSLSMSERDSSDRESPDRLRRSVEMLFGKNESEGWIQTLQSTHLIDVMSFDATAQPRWKSYDLDSESERESTEIILGEANGSTTNLAAALRPMLPRSGNRDPAQSFVQPDEPAGTAASPLAVVLMTDGRDSAGVDDASDLAWQLSQSGWQVHTVGLGSVDEPTDIGITNVLHPERIAADGRLTGTIVAKHYGVTNDTLQIELRSGETLVWSDSFVATQDGQTEIDFDLPVEPLTNRLANQEARGVDRDSLVLPFTASIRRADPTVPTTLGQPENDSWDFRIAAASRDRRLLILDGSSRWETRYLRNLFARDPAWQVNTVLFGPGTDSPQISRGDNDGEVPATTEDWNRFDAIVLGEVPPEQWTEADSVGLREFVRRGGGLIMLNGRYNRLSRIESLNDLLPVEFVDPAGSSENNDLLRYQRQQPSVQSIGPTATGRSQPVMLLSSEIASNEQLWRSMPVPGVIPVTTARADAEVWADALVEATETSSPTDSRVPWLVTRLFGAGRVFFLATDQTWRWRYKIESQLHGRFWNQMLTAAMQPPYAVRDDYVAIGTDKIDYDSGQSALIRVRLLDNETPFGEGASPNTPATVDALLIRDDQIVATLPMNLDDESRRTYLAQTDSLPPGAYHVRVRASGYDASALKATAPIWVEPSRKGELDRVAVDEDTLKEIASAGGGTYVHESSAEEMLSQLLPLSRGQIIETDTLMWESWWLFVAILGLLAAEWWMRKKVGLV
ncbi:putative signal peptide protein [Rhodopirellula islandica]|uniref:Signal peptide protein n=1 Tax=Rhodopirellula islandica TaxID=595434 RepID=A0A0J1BB81_RHOIS|nr:en/Spm transposon protein [Rhodopirellula islandica]KLU03808.1 putative signal peptide protein [Rhodopirellula islandica]